MSESINKLLVTKVSSSLVARTTESGFHEVDTDWIASFGCQLNKLPGNVGVIIVASFARKVLNSHGGYGIVQALDSAIDRSTRTFMVTENNANMRLRRPGRIFEFVRQGGTAVVNANDRHLRSDSLYRNNDYVAAGLVRHAGRSALFAGEIELGMLTDVDGVLRDINDEHSAIPRIENWAFAWLESQVINEVADNNTGGMVTKLYAARDALLQPRVDRVWIANGRTDGVIAEAMAGRIGTTIMRTA